MMRTLQGIDGEGLVKVNENWNVLTCERCAFRLKMFLECILSMWSMMKTD
jgi:hypothetical protein